MLFLLGAFPRQVRGRSRAADRREHDAITRQEFERAHEIGRTAVEPRWTPLAGLTLYPEAEAVRVEGERIGEPVHLGDLLEFEPDGRFLWKGRAADLVKVAGKRASLAALERRLQEIDGMDDAAFFVPDAGGAYFIARLLGTCFYLGYFPKGPGTAGSLGALLVGIPLAMYLEWPAPAFALLAVGLLLPAIWAADRNCALFPAESTNVHKSSGPAPR